MKTFLFTLIAMLAACTSTADVTPAETSAMQWLTVIDSGSYAQSWKESSSSFKANVSRDDWVAALNGVRKPLGALQNREIRKTRLRSSLPGAPDGEYAILSIKSSFENKRKATETLTMVKEDTKWKAVGYFIK